MLFTTGSQEEEDWTLCVVLSVSFLWREFSPGYGVVSRLFRKHLETNTRALLLLNFCVSRSPALPHNLSNGSFF